MIILEISLAIAILAGVILFGGVIALGNERQRRELESIRKEAQAWALGDLKVRRLVLEETVHVDDPHAWLNRLAEKVLGFDPELEAILATENPDAIVTRAKDGRLMAFSPLSPSMLRSIKQNGSGARKGFFGNGHFRFASRLLDMARRHPSVVSELGRSKAIELSLLEVGTSFDIEARKVWEMVTGKRTLSDRWWLYVGKRGQPVPA
ncbi:MAG: hypothetical protein ABSG98_00455 [Anaerolineales bacterium]|jgi:hypothetical protein